MVADLTINLNTSMKPKFRTRCHYIDEPRWAIEDLEKQRMKISLFDAVNDERELRAYGLEGYEHRSRQFFDWATATKALLCFAPDSTDQNMWEEYGGHHRGVCFPLRVKSDHLMEVEYVDQIKIGKFPPKTAEEPGGERIPGETIRRTG
jgi:hypothetical protein